MYSLTIFRFHIMHCTTCLAKKKACSSPTFFEQHTAKSRNFNMQMLGGLLTSEMPSSHRKWIRKHWNYNLKFTFNDLVCLCPEINSKVYMEAKDFDRKFLKADLNGTLSDLAISKLFWLPPEGQEEVNLVVLVGIISFFFHIWSLVICKPQTNLRVFFYQTIEDISFFFH